MLAIYAQGRKGTIDTSLCELLCIYLRIVSSGGHRSPLFSYAARVEGMHFEITRMYRLPQLRSALPSLYCVSSAGSLTVSSQEHSLTNSRYKLSWEADCDQTLPFIHGKSRPRGQYIYLQTVLTLHLLRLLPPYCAAYRLKYSDNNLRSMPGSLCNLHVHVYLILLQ